jgi:hypothetical protein
MTNKHNYHRLKPVGFLSATVCASSPLTQTNERGRYRQAETETGSVRAAHSTRPAKDGGFVLLPKRVKLLKKEKARNTGHTQIQR